MNVIRDNPAAALLPSRHRFALTRLIAFLRFPTRRQAMRVDRLLLVIDRDQSAVENYAVSFGLLAIVICYAAAVLPLLAAIPAAIFAIQIPLCTGLGAKVNGTAVIVLTFLASAHFAVSQSPVRYVAWFFLAVILLNVVAWLVMLTLRGAVRKLEQQCAS